MTSLDPVQHRTRAIVRGGVVSAVGCVLVLTVAVAAAYQSDGDAAVAFRWLCLSAVLGVAAAAVIVGTVRSAPRSDAARVALGVLLALQVVPVVAVVLIGGPEAGTAIVMVGLIFLNAQMLPMLRSLSRSEGGVS